MVRKNKKTSHYREMFGEPRSCTGASSSSAPSSSIPETVPGSQSYQRVSQSPPFGAPLVPPYVAPPVPRFDAPPTIMIMFQRRHLLRWRPGFIPICWCRRLLLILCTPSRTFSLSQAEKVYQSLTPTDRTKHWYVTFLQ